MIHSNDGFETRRPKICKTIKKIKFITINIGCDVKKQHSLSAVRAVCIHQELLG